MSEHAQELAAKRHLPPWATELVFELHDRIRLAVRQQLASSTAADLSAEKHEGAGDVSYGIDVRAEKIVSLVASRAPEPILVVAEGIGAEVFPAGAARSAARVCLIVDPVDGSRELMYQKRSAFVLSGLALVQDGSPDLSNVDFGIVTELPTSRQSQGIQAWAVRGEGAYEQLWDLDSTQPIGAERRMITSQEPSIRGGYATFVHYFPGTHAQMGALADEVLAGVLGPVQPGKAGAFEDAYISTGGQLYLLAAGKYRLVVDARPLLAPELRPLSAHPYDLAGPALLAEESGAIVTNLDGGPLRYPLDTSTDCGYIGYANPLIRDEVRPHLSPGLRRVAAANAAIP
jgi:fructose-1,6-bisphosphatase/inositol monophosphatase family enzyme